MADSELVEGIKLIGGLAGLGTAAFTIFDRTIRDRPIVDLEAHGYRYGDSELYIRVQNPAKRAISITAVHYSEGAPIRLGANETMTSVIRAAMGEFEVAVVPAGGERRLRVVWVGDEPLDEDVTIRLTIEWKPVTAHFWGRPPLLLRTTLRRLRELQAEARRRVEAEHELTRQH